MCLSLSTCTAACPRVGVAVATMGASVVGTTCQHEMRENGSLCRTTTRHRVCSWVAFCQCYLSLFNTERWRQFATNGVGDVIWSLVRFPGALAKAEPLACFAFLLEGRQPGRISATSPFVSFWHHPRVRPSWMA